MDEKRDFEYICAQARKRILTALPAEVEFDGFSEKALAAAIEASGVSAGDAKMAFPRGVIDAAIAFHRAADAEFLDALPQQIAGIGSIRQKIEIALNLRFEIARQNKESIRRASAYFALPQNMATGTMLIFETVDHIWRGIGDEARGFAYYSKRASLAAVYSSVLLFFLQDQENELAGFITRRIDNVMSFGKFTSRVKAPFEKFGFARS